MNLKANLISPGISKNSNQQPNQQNSHCIKKNEIFAIIGTVCLMFFQMSISLSLVMNAHGL